MAEIRLAEVLNNKMQFNFYVPVEECPDIERFVKNYIRVKIGGVNYIGELKKVSTWTKKEKGEIIGIYKEIHLRIESISTEGATELRFPDSKDMFLDDFDILYVTE